MTLATDGGGWIGRVQRREDLAAVLSAFGLDTARPVLVCVGGAGGMAEDDLTMLTALVTDVVAPVLGARGAAVVDGATDSGVMRVLGRSRQAAGGRFPLIGVAAEGTVVLDGPARDGRVELERNHTHVVLVPGTSWGDESEWLSAVASALAGGAPSATLLVNGGEISYQDVNIGVRADRPLLVLSGTGRAADGIGAAAAGEGGDDRDATIASSPLTRVVSVDDPEALAAALTDSLTAAGG
jgi:hypothetical protein